MAFKWLDFKITNRCNNNCVYCGVKHDPPFSSEILPLEYIKNTLSDAISLGFTNFALLGGEPSIREDIERIFSSFEDCPGITLLVITNGLLYNERMYRGAFASGAGIAKIVYSFDSFKKTNYKNQNPKIALTNIDRIHKMANEYNNGFERNVEIHSVISRENYSCFSELVRYFSSKEIDVSLALVCPSEFKKETNQNEYNSFTFDELEIILKQLRELHDEGRLNFANTVLLEYLEKYPYEKLDLKSLCRAGKDHVVIDFNGEVYPCITESYRRGIRYGNITINCFKEIYSKMTDFRCKSEFAAACWDHYLWNRLGEDIDRRK